MKKDRRIIYYTNRKLHILSFQKKQIVLVATLYSEICLETNLIYVEYARHFSPPSEDIYISFCLNGITDKISQQRAKIRNNSNRAIFIINRSSRISSRMLDPPHAFCALTFVLSCSQRGTNLFASGPSDGYHLVTFP